MKSVSERPTAGQRTAARAKSSSRRPDAPGALVPVGPLNPPTIQRLQRTSGNAAVGQLLTGAHSGSGAIHLQRAPTPPTPASIGQALGTVTSAASTKTVKSLRPWVLFETIPWNPSNGKKGKLFSALKTATSRLNRAGEKLADARKRQAALPATPAGSTAPAPAPARSGRRRRARRPRALTAADAQAAVDQAVTQVEKAQKQVDDATTNLKTFVKSNLGSPRNPRTAAVRAERAAAKQERQDYAKQLKAAKRPRRPVQAEVDRLTGLRDAAQQKESVAASKLTALLATLRTEIDAADWGEQDVTRTTTAFQVDGATATVFDKVEAYATVLAGGLEGSAKRNAGGGPTVPDLLAKDVNIGASAKKILTIISAHEGDFTSVNTWDIADVTFGMVQWTTGDGGRGDLVRALSAIKTAAPDAFADRLGRYGIDVNPATGLVLTRPDGTVLTGEPAAKAVQADSKLTAILSAAGTDPAIQEAELRAANEIEVKGALQTRLPVHFPAPGGKKTTVSIPVSALITSEFGVGVLTNHTVHGGFPRGKLQSAVDSYVKAHNISATTKVSDWSPTAESSLVNSISSGIDAGRIAEMRKQLDTGADTFR